MKILVCHKVKKSKGGASMEEPLVTIEIYSEEGDIVSRVQSDLGGIREYRAPTYSEMLRELITDLLEEFEDTLLY